MIATPEDVCHVIPEVTVYKLVYLALLMIVWSMHIEVKGGDFRITAFHLRLTVHHQIVT